MSNPYEVGLVEEPADHFVQVTEAPFGHSFVSRRAVYFLVGMTLFGVLLGAVVGFAIAAVAPDYFSYILPDARMRLTDPLTVGIGLSMAQGALGGLLSGLALIAITYFFKYRPQQAAKESQ